jgi:hypothetical protein
MNYNIAIPHLQPEQCIKDWRVAYVSATSLLKETERIQLLPMAVDRSTADQAWAVVATSKNTLEEALNELEAHIDVQKSRLGAVTDFYRLAPSIKITETNLSDFFFEVFQASKTARLTYDHAAFKLLQHIPECSKLCNDVIKSDMSEEDLFALFDQVRSKLTRGTSAPERVFYSDAPTGEQEECLPDWASDIQQQLTQIKESLELQRLSSKSLPKDKQPQKHRQMFDCKAKGTLWVNGKKLRVDFLFDSGAKTSIMSVDDKEIASMATGGIVHGVGGNQKVGKHINCSFSLDSMDGKVFEHPIRPTQIPGEPALVLLGVDFLSKFGNTLFDWENHRLQLGDSWAYAMSSPSKYDISPSLSSSEKGQINDLINGYADSVFVHNPRAPKKASFGVHKIETKSGRPHKDKVRRTPLKWRDDVSQQLKEMIENKIIQPSVSPYSSNLLLVNKKDLSKRFCVDFRTLNSDTIKDTYPLPNVEDILDRVKGARYFSQLDLASGYWGIPMDPTDREKTAFASHKGKFEFIRMPFGLCNAQATFQRTMDGVVQTVQDTGTDGVEAYVDNLLVFTETFEEHLETLENLFQQVSIANLSLRKDKCEFAKPEIEFLGFIIDGQKVRPTPENIKKVMKFPSPTKRKEVQRFLGVANFNRKFIPNFSEIAAPLSTLTSTKTKFEWTVKHEAAFQAVKTELSKAPSLHLADWNKEFHIETDASGVAVGGVLFQINDKKERLPLAYFSKKLDPSTTKSWTATERELFGVVAASRKWEVYCSGKVIFHTDHLPLKYIRKKHDPRHNSKIGRWLFELENVDYSVEYIPGKENIEADYLSRICLEDEPSEKLSTQELCAVYYQNAVLPTLNVIKEYQKKCPHFILARQQLEDKGEIRKGIFKSYSNLEVKDDILWKGLRIMIPADLIDHVMREYHGQYHHGAENTMLTIKTRFYWRGMEKDIKKFVGACRTCTQCKASRTQHSDIQIPEKVECRERLCIDIACMPRSNQGNTYILQMLDANTKFIATAALSDQQAETIRKTLWPKWFSYFGIPGSLLSDQGPNVDGKVIRDLCRSLNITKIHSSPYHPEGNGSTERSIGSLKSIIRAMCESRKVEVEDWDLLLDEATLAYNSTVNKSTGFSPFQSMFGGDSALPIDQATAVKSSRPSSDPKLVRQNADMNRREVQEAYKQKLDQLANTAILHPGDLVLMKRTFGSYPKLKVKWKEDVKGNPYTVIKKTSNVNYVIRNTTGLERTYHRNMLKPANIRVEPTYTAPVNARSSVRQDAQTTLVSVPIPQQPGQPHDRVVIDQRQFASNVFSNPGPGSNPANPQDQGRVPATPPDQQRVPATSQEVISRVPQTTRLGRVSKPVLGTRHCDNVSL